NALQPECANAPRNADQDRDEHKPAAIWCRQTHFSGVAMIRSLPAFIFAVILISASNVAAQERLCDPQFEDCRDQLINLINNEPPSGGIDVAFWYMADDRYVWALANAYRRHVPIRILVDERAAS